jgi:hypothetical protein
MSTLGTFPLSESKTGFVHTPLGVMHLSSLLPSHKLPKKHKKNPHVQGIAYMPYKRKA